MSQLPLVLPPAPDPEAGRFVLARCNRQAADMIDSWPNWPGPTLALSGPAGSGKTMLSSLWRARSGAVQMTGGTVTVEQAMTFAYGALPICLDQPEKLEEPALLHLLNAVAERRGTLLIEHRAPPAHWPVLLPDLRSRLAALPVVALEQPDDDLLRAILLKKFSAQQVRVSAELLDFVLSRCERSAASVEAVALRLDAAALTLRKPITLPLARAVLAQSTDH